MKKLIGVAAVAALAMGGVAIAAGAAPVSKAPVARVSADDGQVMVDRGGGFVAAGSKTFVSAGDQVRLASSGDMVFADGCSVQVAAKEAFTVAAASPCFAGLTKAAFVQQQAAPAASSSAAGASTSGAAAAGGASAGIGAAAITTPVVVAASVGVLAVAGVVAAAQDDNDDPVSA
ncbi:hypothetical protein [Brevundimonas naejangsanensis]|uniref:hypothetical protein n=1 Tax=Brevundimonas naejangsanensis TaxID=588932 RepID=UPI00106D71C7|nr:hypothetical protein [Brevundimonas naejangsanensis]QBQ47213.1 hypothetical protein E3U41_00030 [Brevundimonas naejangsanensis]